MTQVTQEFVTYIGHLVSKQTVWRRLHGQEIYSHVAAQKQILVSRTGFNDDDGGPQPLTGQYQTTGHAYFPLMN